MVVESREESTVDNGSRSAPQAESMISTTRLGASPRKAAWSCSPERSSRSTRALGVPRKRRRWAAPSRRRIGARKVNVIRRKAERRASEGYLDLLLEAVRQVTVCLRRSRGRKRHRKRRRCRRNWGGGGARVEEEGDGVAAEYLGTPALIHEHSLLLGKELFGKERLLSHVYGLWKEFQPKKQILKTPHVHEKKILLELTCTKVGEASLDRSQLGKSHWDFHLCAFIGDACLCITRVREFMGDAGLCAISSNTRGNS